MKSRCTIIMNTVSLFTWRSNALSHLFLRRCNRRVVTLSILRLSQQRWCRVHLLSLPTNENTSRMARSIAASRLFSYIEELSVKDLLIPPAVGKRRCERLRNRKLGQPEPKGSPSSLRSQENRTQASFLARRWISRKCPCETDSHHRHWCGVRSSMLGARRESGLSSVHGFCVSGVLSFS